MSETFEFGVWVIWGEIRVSYVSGMKERASSRVRPRHGAVANECSGCGGVLAELGAGGAA